MIALQEKFRVAQGTTWILVIDDQPKAEWLTSLELDGYRVIIATTTSDAFRKLCVISFSAIVLDSKMPLGREILGFTQESTRRPMEPNVNAGLRLIECAREQIPGSTDIPIVVWTVNANDELFDRAGYIAAGAKIVDKGDVLDLKAALHSLNLGRPAVISAISEDAFPDFVPYYLDIGSQPVKVFFDECRAHDSEELALAIEELGGEEASFWLESIADREFLLNVRRVVVDDDESQLTANATDPGRSYSGLTLGLCYVDDHLELPLKSIVFEKFPRYRLGGDTLVKGFSCVCLARFLRLARFRSEPRNISVAMLTEENGGKSNIKSARTSMSALGLMITESGFEIPVECAENILTWSSTPSLWAAYDFNLPRQTPIKEPDTSHGNQRKAKLTATYSEWLSQSLDCDSAFATRIEGHPADGVGKILRSVTHFLRSFFRSPLKLEERTIELGITGRQPDDRVVELITAESRVFARVSRGGVFLMACLSGETMAGAIQLLLKYRWSVSSPSQITLWRSETTDCEAEQFAFSELGDQPDHLVGLGTKANPVSTLSMTADYLTVTISSVSQVLNEFSGYENRWPFLTSCSGEEVIIAIGEQHGAEPLEWPSLLSHTAFRLIKPECVTALARRLNELRQKNVLSGQGSTSI